MTDLSEQNEGAHGWKEQINLALNGKNRYLKGYGRCRLLGRGVVSGFAFRGSAQEAHSFMAVYPGKTSDTDRLEFGYIHPSFPFDEKRLGLLALQAIPDVTSSFLGGRNNLKPFDAERHELLVKNLPIAIIVLYGTVAGSNPQDEFADLMCPADIGPWRAMRAFEDPVLEYLGMLDRANKFNFDEV